MKLNPNQSWGNFLKAAKYYSSTPAKEEYIARSKLGLSDFEIIMCNGDYKEALKILLEKIEKAPAADVVERPRWIPVTERLPEESEGLDWREEMMIRFTSVWCCDAKTGTIEVRNRFQGKMTGNEYLDQYTKDTDWHWSKSWWEPTHWMPIVPLPEPPEGDA